MADFEVRYQELQHSYFGLLRRRCPPTPPYWWETNTDALTNWKLNMIRRLNPDDVLRVNPFASKLGSQLHVWTDVEGYITPPQVSAFESFLAARNTIIELLPNELRLATESFIDEEILFCPSLKEQLHEFRKSYPFPVGEVDHHTTVIRNTHWMGVPFMILLFAWSWSSERSAQILLHDNQVLGVRFYPWEEHEMIEAATRFRPAS
jgi:hypothetical protein